MKAKFKKSFTILLTILSLSTPNIASAHAHVYIRTDYGISYYDYGEDHHEKVEYSNYACSCGSTKNDVTRVTQESHQFTSYSYTGYNYHAGNFHVLEYARSCRYCSHRDSYLDRISCSGPPCPYY